MLFQALTNLWDYRKGGCHLFAMQFFYSFSRDDPILDSEETQIAPPIDYP